MTLAPEDITLYFKTDPPSAGLYVRVLHPDPSLKEVELDMLKQVSEDILDIGLNYLGMDSVPWVFQEVYLRQCFFLHKHNLVSQPVSNQRLGSTAEIFDKKVFEAEITSEQFYAAFRVAQRLLTKLAADSKASTGVKPWIKMMSDFEDYQMMERVRPAQSSLEHSSARLKAENLQLQGRLQQVQWECQKLRQQLKDDGRTPATTPASSRPESALSKTSGGTADRAADMLLSRLQGIDLDSAFASRENTPGAGTRGGSSPSITSTMTPTGANAQVGSSSSSSGSKGKPVPPVPPVPRVPPLPPPVEGSSGGESSAREQPKTPLNLGAVRKAMGKSGKPVN